MSDTRAAALRSGLCLIVLIVCGGCRTTRTASGFTAPSPAAATADDPESSSDVIGVSSDKGAKSDSLHLVPAELLVLPDSLASREGDQRAAVISQVALNSEAPAEDGGTTGLLADDATSNQAIPPVDNSDVLELDSLVAEVIQVNPSMQAAVAAWQEASQRYPQAVSLDDPMLLAMIGPASFGRNDVNGAYTVGISQKIPWKGKLALRGQMALWEQTAAQWDTQDIRLQLTEAAKLAYFEYYLVYRELEVNVDNLARVEEFRETARSRYEAGQVPQQDYLQAEVDIGQLKQRRLELERQKQVAIARINTLLHRLPVSPLLPPPLRLEVPDDPLQLDSLHQLAVQSRPDLTALSARIQSERASIALACKEFYPDFDVMARYDAFWQENPLRPMIGVNLNIPLYQGKRHAAVNEAIFRTNKLCAEYAKQSDAVLNDVQVAHARLQESQDVVALYRTQIMPAAETNVASAEAGYAAGRIDFLRLIEAQRQLIELSEQQHQAVADYFSRRAELERIVGQPLVVPADNR